MSDHYKLLPPLYGEGKGRGLTMTLKVIEILPLQQGVSQRGEWRNQQIVVEEKIALPRPDRFLLRFNGEHVDKLAGIKVGDEIQAKWTNTVRFFEKDGRKFYSQECNVWSMENVSSF